MSGPQGLIDDAATLPWDGSFPKSVFEGDVSIKLLHVAMGLTMVCFMGGALSFLSTSTFVCELSSSLGRHP